MFMESITQTEASVGRILDLGPASICVGHGKPLPASAVKLDKRKMKSAPKRTEKEEDLEDLASGLF
jgi:hypothetical protein